ncbi:hypothetical protein SCUP234_08356 [Seiridium cupressi]
MTSPIGTDNRHMPKPEYRDTFGVCEEHLAAAARYRQLAQWEDILREFEHADTYRSPGALSEPNRTKPEGALTGNMSEAVRYRKIWQKKTSHPRETSLRTLLRSLSTSSLLRDDQVNVAKELLEPSYLHDMQACAVALCKEPSDEHSEYLRALADTDITLDQYNEQGYNALDYAVFNSEHEMERVVLRSLAKYHSPERVAGLKREALHKKHSREILHRHMRPVLTQGGNKIFQNLRDRYATLLGIDEAKMDLFNEFRVVRYSDFVKLGRLPSASDDITRKLLSVDVARYGQTSEETVVFLS